ncbi:helicase C-terminal domain-containing protein [Zychaea mexicana]|uniref:helicase C-terminal domain-containing protein n=1 Tax=Zychaea mexicana TaxID=64656 RepID=UPI0022FE86BB|nr:helicase C-terminal domain-containing protein [Zychaea mexicana]KAI9489392.1 helicase C-terminal domain-containing protein [Zychaea mexicana]
MVDRDYGFPYQPYTIQNDFMNSLYTTLSQGKIGIFESPTGTGKSLSLICGSLRWLKDQDNPDTENPKTDNKQNTHGKDNDEQEPDWLRAFQVTNKAEEQREALRKERRKELKKRIQYARQQEDSKTGYVFGDGYPRWNKRQKTNGSDKKKKGNDEDDNDEFLLDEYTSDDEEDGASGKKTATADSNSNLSKEVRELLAKLEPQKGASSRQTDQEEDEEDEFEEFKIYYTSRTHSQLSQFIHEVHKTIYKEDTWTVPLGSRKNACIHKDIKKLKSVQRMNEACLDLQKKTSTAARCSYLPAKTERMQWNAFRDHALAKVRDIEDLVQVGEQMGICPYYGSRHTLRPAQLIVLPYQHLLHASTRESLGISLKNSVVIIDEAHNLIETVTAIHTVTVSYHQARMAFSQLKTYLQRYKNRLLGKNIAYIRQTVHIVKALLKLLEPATTADDRNNKKKDTVIRVNEFVHMLGIDHINMFKIEKYLKASNLARKLNGFIDKELQKQQQQQQANETSDQQQQLSNSSNTAMPTLTQIEAFLLALTNPDKDGRIVVNYSTESSEVKYMLLNPAEVFRPIVEDAKSIILAGGTMEPISDFTNILLHDVPSAQINRLSCGHIIPPSNMAVMSIDAGPTGKPFLFRYDSRQDEKLMDEVGQAIVNLCNVIPDGVVCFFSSFTYLEQVYKRWASGNSNNNVLARLSKKKKILKEPRESNKVETTLRDYAMHIDQSGGALLLCVVNGKMSEGINFSDQLGRGVIMVGLPFANKGSVELQEKIKYAGDMNPSQSDAGNEYYENMCMRGVNQSIGRAIRHKNDYATIILLDQRYSHARIRNKLPGWIGNRIDHCEKFGMAMGNTVRFFKQFRQ